MQYYVHLFHDSGRIDLYGPDPDKNNAIVRAKLIYRNYDGRSWSVAVTANDGTLDPDEFYSFVWYREARP
jgi:hypothetical protein